MPSNADIQRGKRVYLCLPKIGENVVLLKKLSKHR